MPRVTYPLDTSDYPYAADGEDTCTAMTDLPEGEDACAYGDGVGFCTLVPGHAGLHLCTCTEHTF